MDGNPVSQRSKVQVRFQAIRPEIFEIYGCSSSLRWEDWNLRKAFRERGKDLLQALQASHFMSVYDDSPLVANALPLTQRVIDDYLRSAHYASRNLDPLLAEGSIPSPK
ncbi:hypothetical protein KIN20_002581 [Parelaphostrongylus tenuis]|uniref:Uncharacterized protein n=1 Tax=Parelaphostrongylus tenuis TaxID=148309 RepID=A0AAD5LXZ3_PARTN|nr:hypothetical protein KIN20_002581 [Parelaphostrongylus tenuis]